RKFKGGFKDGPKTEAPLLAEVNARTLAFKRVAQRKPRREHMHTNLELDRPRLVIVAVASALATVISIGILGAVAGLFQSRGLPLEELAAAERACAGHAYVSDQERCMREWAAAAQGNRVARRWLL